VGAVRTDRHRDVSTLVDVGVGLGRRATFLQFSSEFCAACRSTRSTLALVAGEVDGVMHVEVDAQDRLDLVRRFNILRTPTVLVLDPHGRAVRRASGVMTVTQARAAVFDLVAQGADS
jgi:thiol-disulfide isomerase/thioredoxin